MSRRLARVIRRILATPGGAGQARVLGYEGPGAVRLQGREERVLVAGAAMPAIGQLAVWLRADEGTLVTSCNPALPRFAPGLLRAGKAWEQVLVVTAMSGLKLGFAHRDSSGRYWVKMNAHYYSQEPDDFATPNWTFRGQGKNCDVQGGATLGVGDQVIELGREPLPGVNARIVEIDPDTGALTFGDMGDALPDGRLTLDCSICQDAQGYFHVAGWDGGGALWGEQMWRSAQPNSIASWERVHYQVHDIPPDNWRRPYLTAVGDQVVCFRASPYYYNEDAYLGVRYRVWSGSAWGAEIDPGFSCAGRTVQCLGLPDGRIHIAYQDLERGLVWRQGRLSGGLIEWEDEAVLFDYYYAGEAAFQRNFEADSAPEVAWAAGSYESGDGRLARYGLPPGDPDEDIPSPSAVNRIADTTRGIVAGGGWEQPAMDGFCAFRQGATVYAARIVEE